VADAGLALRLRLDQAEQPQAGGIGQHLQRRREPLRLVALEAGATEERRAGGNCRSDGRKRAHAFILTEIDTSGIIASTAIDMGGLGE
jgi:hypothetical protein